MTMQRNTSPVRHTYTGYDVISNADLVRHNGTLIGVFPKHREHLPPPAQPGMDCASRGG
jgi:hypothetical protein